MIVVSNTSPVYYLWQIEEIGLLSVLFQKIVIPEAVFKELTDKSCPKILRKKLKNSTDWLEIKKISNTADAELDRLHPGEKEAILLAEEINADLILLDEKHARTIARQKGLNVTGLLGILDEAAKRNLINIIDTIEKLNTANFRISPSILKQVLEKYKGNF